MMPNAIADRLRVVADDPHWDLNTEHHLLREAADEIEKWRTLAVDWMNIAAVLICPDDDDTERLAWASGQGWDALQARTRMALGLRAADTR